MPPEKRFKDKLNDWFKRDPNRITGSGRTALQEAIHRRRADKVAKLLQQGADPNFSGMLSPSRKPLAMAIMRKDMFVMSMLIKAGAEPDGHIGNSSYLYYSVLNKHIKGTEVLLKQSPIADIRNEWNDETALFALADIEEANESYIESAVKLLADNGTPLNAINRDGETALYQAMEKGQYLVAFYLLHAGADPNITPAGRPHILSTILDTLNDSPELWNVAKMLLAHNANPNVTSGQNMSVLHWAITFNDQDMVRFAANNCENIYTPDYLGNTALHYAMDTGDAWMADFTLNLYEKLPHQKNMRGFTAFDIFMWQFSNPQSDRNYKVIEKMLHKGFDPDYRDANGYTMLEHAVEKGNYRLAKIMIKNKADVNLIKNDGHYPLLMAVHNNDLDIVDLLLDHDAEPNTPNERGWTILDILAKNGDRTSSMVQRLIAGGGEYRKQLPAADNVHQFTPKKLKYQNPKDGNDMPKAIHRRPPKM